MRPTPAVSLILLAGLLALLVLFQSRHEQRYLDRPSIQGEVRDECGPIEDALVRFKGASASTMTDQHGRFSLPDSTASPRITAMKPGYFIAGVRRDALPFRLQLHRLPAADNPDYAWVDPTPDPHGEHNCANCHRHIYQEWRDSGHGRSATGRQFRDLYTGAGGGWGLLTQHPDGRGVCAACHAPTVKPGDPALLRLDKVSGVPAQGVHCDYCHKVSGIGNDEIGLAHGRDLLQLLRPTEGQLFFGPLDDVDRGDDVFSPFMRDSRACAACHEGVVFGVHVYSTYSEWLDSPARGAGQHCQHCHMKPTGRLTNIAPGKGGIERDPFTLGNHLFFAESRADMLRRCLRVQVSRTGTSVAIELRTEGVGHRVPTGFIDRHLLLIVEAHDNTGQPIELRSGPRLPPFAGPDLNGKPGKLFAKLLRDEQGRQPAPFWLALPDSDDSRLQPGRPEFLQFHFAAQPVSVRVRVVHRRFWTEVERQKQWPTSDFVVVDKVWKL